MAFHEGLQKKEYDKRDSHLIFELAAVLTQKIGSHKYIKSEIGE